VPSPTASSIAEAHARRGVMEIVGPMIGALRRIEAHHPLSSYSVIVGEDTSGRIPTRMVRAVVSHERRALGLPGVTAFFLPGAGGHDPLAGAFDAALARRAPLIRAAAAGGRTLIVTDAVHSGKGIALMAQALTGMGIECDVLAVVRASPWYHAAQLWPLPESTLLVAGRESDRQLVIDGDHSISGVAKTWRVHALTSPHVRPTAFAARRIAASLVPVVEKGLG
jgi:hypothetical protein